MQHGDGHAAWTWTCSMDMDMQRRHGYCSGQKTPDSSEGRLSVALGNLGSGNLEGGGFGGKGRSVYKQPETEVDGSCHS
jgi:hypothetical protein